MYYCLNFCFILLFYSNFSLMIRLMKYPIISSFLMLAPLLAAKKVEQRRESNIQKADAFRPYPQRLKRDELELLVTSKRKNFLESDPQSTAHYTALGIACYEQGDLTEAFYYFLKTTAIYEEKFEVESAALFLPYCYIALIYAAFRQHKMAQHYEMRARKVFDRHTAAAFATEERHFNPTFLAHTLREMEKTQLPLPKAPNGYQNKKKKKRGQSLRSMMAFYSLFAALELMGLYHFFNARENLTHLGTSAFLAFISFFLLLLSGTFLRGWKEVDGLDFYPFSVRFPAAYQKNRSLAPLKSIFWFFYPFEGKLYSFKSIDSVVIKNKYLNLKRKKVAEYHGVSQRAPISYLALKIDTHDQGSSLSYEFDYVDPTSDDIPAHFFFDLYDLLRGGCPIYFSYRNYRAEIEDL